MCLWSFWRRKCKLLLSLFQDWHLWQVELHRSLLTSAGMEGAGLLPILHPVGRVELSWRVRAHPPASSRTSESPWTSEATLQTANLGGINYPFYKEYLIASWSVQLDAGLLLNIFYCWWKFNILLCLMTAIISVKMVPRSSNWASMPILVLAFPIYGVPDFASLNVCLVSWDS